jgi:hypothetical protein
MAHACIARFAYRSLMFGMCSIGAAVAHPAFAAGSQFDASYHGPQTVTFGAAPECGSDAEASITITDGELKYGFGAFPLRIQVAQDGNFRGRVRKGNKGGGQAMRIKGRVSESDLQADFIVNGVHGHVCSYHWSLRKV